MRCRGCQEDRPMVERSRYCKGCHYTRYRSIPRRAARAGPRAVRIMQAEERRLGVENPPDLTAEEVGLIFRRLKFRCSISGRRHPAKYLHLTRLRVHEPFHPVTNCTLVGIPEMYWSSSDSE